MSHIAPLEPIRNIGIIAHIDAGKTTTTERILFYTGRTHRIGSVDDGTTVTDWMDQERERGITIVAAAVTAHWRGHQINLIDTPGHIDFTAEVQRALRVLDGGVVVLDAVRGVEPQSETVWRQADRFHVPRVCFINKMDRVGADFSHAVQMITDRLGAVPAVIQIPIGTEAQFCGVIDLVHERAIYWPDELGAHPQTQELPDAERPRAARAREQLIEGLAEHDDTLLECYLGSQPVPPAMLAAALRRLTLANRVVPVLCGSALRNKGVQPLLDAIVDYLPSPDEVGTLAGTDPDSGSPVSIAPSADEPLVAYIFKTVTDPFVGHLTYVRVYAGRLAGGDRVYNASRRRSAHIGRMVRMYADHKEEMQAAYAGDIVALLSFKEAATGETLCAQARPVLLESVTFPEPVMSIALSPATKAEIDTTARALRDLAADDPTFRVNVDADTGETILSGMGELHLEVLVERLRREHGVKVRTGPPSVAYKETIARAVPRVEGRYVRQSGGHGQYGVVIVRLEPLARGAGITFEDRTAGGAIPRQFIPAIEAGIRGAAAFGTPRATAVVDIGVTLLDGSFHDVDSSELAFRNAAMQAFRQGLELVGTVLLEPIVKLSVLTPDDFLGDVLQQIAVRTGDVDQVRASTGGVQEVLGRVPLEKMFGFATQLRSATHGRATFSMEFHEYAPARQTLRASRVKA